MTQAFITQLKNIVGNAQVLTGERSTERYRKGFRSGGGKALAVVFLPVCCNCGRSCKPASPPIRL
ncbi:D-lactate dehydrogenase [Serratia fonticola]|uniref:D-lactate dehydrogenase n=1 Tax=Serratia fonticola TaxID=47917 RepID=A0A4U9W244_SERFO|nr:D-lactate dehydrogenase [Serratia fonticola]